MGWIAKQVTCNGAGTGARMSRDGQHLTELLHIGIRSADYILCSSDALKHFSFEWFFNVIKKKVKELDLE